MKLADHTVIRVPARRAVCAAIFSLLLAVPPPPSPVCCCRRRWSVVGGGGGSDGLPSAEKGWTGLRVARFVLGYARSAQRESPVLCLLQSFHLPPSLRSPLTAS